MTRLLLLLLAASSVASALFLGLLLRQGRADRDRLYREAREADRASAHYAELWLRAEGRLDYCKAL